MTPELWQRLKPLFGAALDRAIEDRPAYIDQACGDDAELKAHLIQLVQAAQDETKTFDGPSAGLFPSRAARFYPGEVILERFRIVRPIGSGGMGEVYEAEDLQLGRVALKTIREEIAASAAAFHRFRQEVQLARKVSGARVCRIHELYLLPASGSHAATAFLTMEYLDGITLTAKLKRDGPLPLKDALRVALDICEGLRLVHEMGVIHRDLKSANIMLCGEAVSLRAVLMDFGLARDFSEDSLPPQGAEDGARDSATLPGAILGTPAYMAPEQFEAKPVSPATDIYALGVVLYELVTGLHPYAAPTPVAAAIRRAKYPLAPSSLNLAIPRKWDRVIQRCLQYEPADRFQSADAVARQLRGGFEEIRHLNHDRPWLFRVASVLILAGVAWGIYAIWQWQTIYKPGPEALREYTDGLSLIRQGNYAEATRVLNDAVKKEPGFVMAHARLAEAWYNLDFQGSAQQELLTALPMRNRLTRLDRMYLDAIQQTVTPDASAALETRRRILGQLPSAERSSGEVDLGMAYERVGDIPHALDSYAQAAREDKNNPAAYMHAGILESRLHHVKEGDEAFDLAQAIFEKELDSHGGAGNPEGLAELDYERGYAANDRGDPKGAKSLLEQSRNEAQKIPSSQLEIRALAQIIVAEYDSDDYVESQKHAEDMKDLAIRNGLQAWVADGNLRLANAMIARRKPQDAEKPLKEAADALELSPRPRVEAFANLTKASLKDQEHKPAEVPGPARAALDYYKTHGFFLNAYDADLLLIRAERNQGHFKNALDSGSEFLALAGKAGIPVLTMQAEELVGTIDLALEQYPDALTHFQNARQVATKESNLANMDLHCAEALWRLGRYPESDAMLQLAASAPSLLVNVAESRAKSLLSQRKYSPTLTLVQNEIAGEPNMQADRKIDLEQDETVAESHLGMKKQALLGLQAFVVPDLASNNLDDAAQARLTAAEVHLSVGMFQQAHDEAATANAYFTSIGQRDSELRSACLAAMAAKSLRDELDFGLWSKKILDILLQIRQTWGPDSYQRYLSRPDLRFLMTGAGKSQG